MMLIGNPQAALMRRINALGELRKAPNRRPTSGSPVVGDAVNPSREASWRHRSAPRRISGISRRFLKAPLGFIFLLGAGVLTACSEPDVGGLAQDYCDYYAQAPAMEFKRKSEVITALDRRLLDMDVGQGRMLTELRLACPAVIARTEARMMGIMGEKLAQMQREMHELEAQ